MRRFTATPPLVADANGHGMNWRDGLIATVAFNRPDVTRWQIHLVKRYLADAHSFLVADNSTNPDRRAEIRAVCAEAGVPYFSLPENLFRASRSHGAAMNWVFETLVRRDQPAFFGFLDHDIFPLEHLSIAAKLEGRGLYGVRRTETPTAGGWFLWAGYSFFDGKYARQELDFLPSDYYKMDTGGGNWPIFRDIASDEVRFAPIEWMRIGPGDDPFSDFFQLIDGWLHVWNTSQWKKSEADRSGALLELLRKAAGPDAPDWPLERV